MCVPVLCVGEVWGASRAVLWTRLRSRSRSDWLLVPRADPVSVRAWRHSSAPIRGQRSLNQVMEAGLGLSDLLFPEFDLELSNILIPWSSGCADGDVCLRKSLVSRCLDISEYVAYIYNTHKYALCSAFQSNLITFPLKKVKFTIYFYNCIKCCIDCRL